MAKFEDSISIAAGSQQVRELLSDLERHPSFVPDGFKQYRVLSRQAAGPGARAAAALNLMGHWLPAELEVAVSAPQQVVLNAALEPVDLELRFDLVDRGGRTEVRMGVDFKRRMLPPWRIRTRIKQRLRLEQDVRGLVSRFLTMLKEAAEKAGTTTQDAAGARAAEKAGTAAQDAAGARAVGQGAGNARAAAQDTTRARAESPAGPTAQPRTAAASAGNGAATPEFVSAGLESELGPGQAKVVKVGDREVAVFNVGGDLHAIDNRCPHRGGPLGFGVLDGTIVTCPLHSFRFDVTTGQCPDMAHLKVARYELRRHDGELQIRSTPVPS